jgi:alpha-aminoadipate carrier protein LysW
MAECPVCATNIEKDDDIVKGEILECPECGAELEVKKLSPFTLVEAPQEEEDWGQ